jgi:hypothetical protein
LVTGGSDYHGPGTRRAESFGVVDLPARYLELLLSRASQHSNMALREA